MRIGKKAEEANISFVAPWHFNKREGTDVALRMMDSRGFRTATRAILLAAADPESEGDICLGLDKANGSTIHVPALRFHIDTHHYQVEEIDDQTGEVELINTTCGVAKFLGEVPNSSPGGDYVRGLFKSSPSMAKDHDPKGWLGSYLINANNLTL